MRYSIDDILRIYKIKDSHYFDDDTMGFLKSKVNPSIYQGPGGVYFTTRYGDPKMKVRTTYTVRRFFPETGDIRTVGDYKGLTKMKAHYRARMLANPKESK